MNLDKHHHVSQSILGLANWYCIFHSSCTSFYFPTVISVFRTSIYAVFVMDRTRKQTLLIKWFNFAFTKDLPSISLSNVQTVNAEKEEEYTLSNMIYIKLQICWCMSYYIYVDVYFEAPKMYTNQWNNICNGRVHFFICRFTKNMLLNKWFSIFLLRFVL